MSSLDEDEYEKRMLEERFGTLLSISETSLIALASNFREKLSGRPPSSADRVVSRLSGSYNLVHIVEFHDGLRYVIRVPATGWGGQFTETARRSFISQALTMRLLSKETTIPIPEVYAFDAASTNEIGAPYILMSFIPGDTVSSKWFDETGPTPLEERRLRTLDSVASAMSQLRKFQFDKIGALQFLPGTSDSLGDTITVGPCYQWEEPDFEDEKGIQDIRIIEFGPFETSKSYLQHYLNNTRPVLKKARPGRGSCAFLDMMIPYLPPSGKRSSTKETFVISLPDFDSQNIMIDEQGNLTGIIDWDHVQTVPRFLGYASFPGWITRDWDPLMYVYYHLPDRENSPEELKRYRRRYKAKMHEMLRGGGDARYTGKSHIFENVGIAMMNDGPRSNIVEKILERVFPVTEDYRTFNLIDDAADGNLEPKVKRKLESAFQAFLSVSRYV